MPKLMLVTSRTSHPGGGRDQLSQLHRRCLETLFGDELIVEELDPRSVGGPIAYFSALGGRLDGLSREAEARILDRARADGVGRIFLNGSNLGRLARSVRKRMPGVEVLTFFHNVEARFFLGSLRQRRSARSLAILLANYLAERAAVQNSDCLIVLSTRDSDGLARLYGRSATDILPMAIEDKRQDQPARQKAGRRDFVLFVGGAFYANQIGIRWFAREVAPAIGLETMVVGRGLEALRSELERGGKVRVIGGVDRLDPYYQGAKVVIAPIFDGSGMKTKVAEALMFGKRIVGTSEAFSGYEAVAGQAGWICDGRHEFISALREAESMAFPEFDPSLRALYEQHYSFEAALAGLSRILGPARQAGARKNRAA